MFTETPTRKPNVCLHMLLHIQLLVLIALLNLICKHLSIVHQVASIVVPSPSLQDMPERVCRGDTHVCRGNTNTQGTGNGSVEQVVMHHCSFAAKQKTDTVKWVFDVRYCSSEGATFVCTDRPWVLCVINL